MRRNLGCCPQLVYFVTLHVASLLPFLLDCVAICLLFAHFPLRRSSYLIFLHEALCATSSPLLFFTCLSVYQFWVMVVNFGLDGRWPVVIYVFIFMIARSFFSLPFCVFSYGLAFIETNVFPHFAS